MSKSVWIRTALSLTVLFSVLCSACNSVNVEEGSSFFVYFKNATKRELYPVEAVIDEELPFDTRIASVWRHLVTSSDQAVYTSPVPSSISLKNYTLDDHNLILNYDLPYKQLSDSVEMIFRASVVKTFTQFPEISTVEIQVESQPLTLSDGTPVGPMKSSDFIDVFGTGLNAYSEANMTLFFSDSQSTGLLTETDRIMYSNSISLEQAIVQRLIRGPEDEDLYPTLPEDMKVLSVSTQGGVCYVNLNDAFFNNPVVAKPELAVYSIVNSLTEMKGINSVVISVNGSNTVLFMDQFDLSKPLYRNFDLVLSGSSPSLKETGTSEEK